MEIITMYYAQSVINEIVKSTFLTIVFFTLFDIFIQGYSNYHNWILPILATMATTYYLALHYIKKIKKFIPSQKKLHAA